MKIATTHFEYGSGKQGMVNARLRQRGSVRRVTPSVLLVLAVIFLATDIQAAPVPQVRHRSTRIEGMLIGTLLGDAAGGPVEFKTPEQVRHVMPATRSWPEDRLLTPEEIKTLSRSFPLLAYADLRPDPEPYGHWTARAPAGTVTDDSRMKIILMNTLRHANQHDSLPVTRRDFARQFVDFINTPSIRSQEHYTGLCRDNLREFVKSARWVLGERNLDIALPPERMWGGVPTCAGQMALLPLAT